MIQIFKKSRFKYILRLVSLQLRQMAAAATSSILATGGGNISLAGSRAAKSALLLRGAIFPEKEARSARKQNKTRLQRKHKLSKFRHDCQIKSYIYMCCDWHETIFATLFRKSDLHKFVFVSHCKFRFECSMLYFIEPLKGKYYFQCNGVEQKY